MKKFLLNLTVCAAALSFSACTKKAEKAMVEMNTSMGKIVIEVYPDKAPKTVENFLEYVKSGYYDGTIFHRVIDGFVIQGGGLDSSMSEKKTRAPIVNEANNGLKNSQFTLSMARTNDPNSATSQFFINLVDNPRLDYAAGRSDGYAVFGKVVEGTDIVQKIGKTATVSAGMYRDVPKDPIVVTSAKVQGK